MRTDKNIFKAKKEKDFLNKVFMMFFLFFVCLYLFFVLYSSKNNSINQFNDAYKYNPNNELEMINEKLNRLHDVFVLEGRWPAGLFWPGECENESE